MRSAGRLGARAWLHGRALDIFGQQLVHVGRIGTQQLSIESAQLGGKLCERARIERAGGTRG